MLYQNATFRLTIPAIAFVFCTLLCILYLEERLYLYCKIYSFCFKLYLLWSLQWNICSFLP